MRRSLCCISLILSFALAVSTSAQSPSPNIPRCSGEAAPSAPSTPQSRIPPALSCSMHFLAACPKELTSTCISAAPSTLRPSSPTPPPDHLCVNPATLSFTKTSALPAASRPSLSVEKATSPPPLPSAPIRKPKNSTTPSSTPSHAQLRPHPRHQRPRPVLRHVLPLRRHRQSPPRRVARRDRHPRRLSERAVPRNHADSELHQRRQTRLSNRLAASP